MRFDKGYVENYSEEVFTVLERVPRVPPVYRIREEIGRKMDSFLIHKNYWLLIEIWIHSI
jgi:hypothetical protein